MTRAQTKKQLRIHGIDKDDEIRTSQILSLVIKQNNLLEIVLRWHVC